MSAQAARKIRPVADVELMRQLASGDLTALGQLYDRYSDDVRRFAYRATGRAEVADDIAHDAFLALAGAAERYDGEHPVRSFLLGIVAKLVLRRKRSLAQRLRSLALFGATTERASEPTPEDETGSRLELERFSMALDRLSPAKRLVVLLCDVEGLSGEQVAGALDIPLGTVWTRLHYGRRELRKVLARPPRAKGGAA
jgi:RNA polymerase sigma-70 factor (ECF subfamily)